MSQTPAGGGGMCLCILCAWMGPYVLKDNHPIYRAHEKRAEPSKKHAREHRPSCLLSGCGGLSPPTVPRSSESGSEGTRGSNRAGAVLAQSSAHKPISATTAGTIARLCPNRGLSLRWGTQGGELQGRIPSQRPPATCQSPVFLWILL